MKKIFTLIILLASITLNAQISSFPYSQGFETAFTYGNGVQFIPNWTGNVVASGFRIHPDSANARTGQVALGVIPTSTFSGEIIIGLNLTGISNLTADFWAKSELNDVGDRPAIVYFSTSTDGGVTYSTPSQIGDSTSFPNASTSYSNYVYVFPFATYNQPDVRLKISVTRGNGITGGTAAKWLMDDLVFAASANDLIPPTADAASASSLNSVVVTFSEPVDASAETLSNYTGIPNITSAVRSSGNTVVTLNLSAPLQEGVFYTLGVANVQDIAGNAMTTPASFNIVFNDNAGNVKITEIMYNNPGIDSLEFIEIRNLEPNPVIIGGWRFTSGVQGTFPSGLTLNPYEYVVFSKYKSVVDAFFGINTYEWDPTYSLINSGANISIYNTVGVLVDSVGYGTAAPWPTGANGMGGSLSLCYELTDNDNGANWMESMDFAGMFFGGTNTDSVFASPGSECITVGLTEIGFSSDKISVYPNPSSGSFKVILPGISNQLMNCTVTDITGKTVMTFEINQGISEFNVDMSAFTPGMYMLRTGTDTNAVYSRVVIN